MRPLFTLHAGEYLVGAHVEQTYKRTNVWVPTRDTGIDLLVSDRLNRRSVSLQVKFSKDFLVTHHGAEFQKDIRACGWWTIKRSKLSASRADFWVLVLQGFASRSTDFVILPRAQLLKRLDAIHGRQKLFQMYLWITERGRCWETRGLTRAQERQVAQGSFRNPPRDMSKWLNNWAPVARLNAASPRRQAEASGR